MFLLDTDHIGIIQRRTGPEFDRLWQRIGAQPPDLFYTSIISFHEQVLGWNSCLNQARDAAGVIRGYGMLERILADFAAARVLPFDTPAANQFAALRSGGVRVGTLDLRIAAIAVARSLIVLTRNVTDFRKVPGVHVEDWTV